MTMTMTILAGTVMGQQITATMTMSAPLSWLLHLRDNDSPGWPLTVKAVPFPLVRDNDNLMSLSLLATMTMTIPADPSFSCPFYLLDNDNPGYNGIRDNDNPRRQTIVQKSTKNHTKSTRFHLKSYKIHQNRPKIASKSIKNHTKSTKIDQKSYKILQNRSKIIQNPPKST